MVITKQNLIKPILSQGYMASEKKLVSLHTCLKREHTFVIVYSYLISGSDLSYIYLYPAPCQINSSTCLLKMASD